jgi:PAS domain S-box-containing protein
VDPSTFQPTAAEGFRFYAPSARPIIEKAFQRTIDCGEPYDLELEFITAKGNKRWVHTMGRASREDGKTRMVAGTFQDITARKQAEDELRTYRLHLEELVEQRTAELQKSNEALACEVENRKGVEAALRSANEHLDSLFNYANAPIIVWDSEYRITRFNHAFELLTGKCADDVLGKSLEMLFPSDRVAASMVLIRKALEGERWESVEINIQHLDGTVRTLLWNSATVYAPDAKTPVATIAQGYDITERKRAEGALRESEDRFRATFEQAAVGIAQVGLDGRWLRVNQRLCDIVGYTREELLRFTFQDITHPDDLDSDLAFFRQVLAGEISTYSMEKRYYRKDRSLVWVNLTVGVVRDEEGTPQYFVSVVEDIAKRKQAEESLSTVMLDLERSNKDLEQFAYVASHDLQEPLRKVASFTQLLAERYADRLDADARQFIAYAVDGAHRMQRLINDLLAYSRVGTRGVRFAPVNCETVFAYAVANLEVAIKESGAVVTRDALPTVTGDEVQLVQLFQNLIGNGIKFHGVAPPCVHVSVTRQEKEWIFQVRDNGIGIDPQYFDRLFVIFQRLHAMAQYPGTGIGLAISKKVVERHGGRIWVESEPERGASFFFSIPIGEG